MTEETEFAIYADEPEVQITEYVAIYRVLKEEADRIKGKLDACKSYLLPLVEEHGKYTDSSGYAQLVEPSERVSYDNKALEALRKSVPEAREMLDPPSQGDTA